MVIVCKMITFDYVLRVKFLFLVICIAFVTNTILCVDGTDQHRNYITNDEPSSYIFETEKFPDDGNLMPTLSNGHLGFTTFGDTVHMNALYNGMHGLSHRARIPNWANIRIHLQPIDKDDEIKKLYSFNVKTGVLTVILTTTQSSFEIIHQIYAHRYYDRAVVNEVEISRLNYTGNITIELVQQAGNSSKDITFDATYAISANNQILNARCGKTNEVEDPKYQANGKRVCVLWNQVPEEITLSSDMQNMSSTFVMTVDGDLGVAAQEITKALSDEKLLDSHISEWDKFWSSFEITVSGNIELSRVIYASIFYLVSSLPSYNTFSESNIYYGLSPTGLGRGETFDDYEGHSFWDTEIWMHPAILLMNPKWSETLLHYRTFMLSTAINNAKSAGYKGARFPWESAYTGSETTQPCCPLVAQNQLHITADISFAVRNHLGATNDMEWLNNEGCQLAIEIARFWASRVTFNESNGFYELRDVMGPDEDHATVSNNAYTNVVVGYALYFADFASCLCNNGDSLSNEAAKWREIAKHLALLYNEISNYHPQFEGYELGTRIKQADTILIGYPLLYEMATSTRKNNLEFYEKVTRSTGPAMTWAMHTINHLDLNEIDKADVLFLKSYQNNIRPPFNVWSEVVEGEIGAINFLTGSGGFLQAVLNGYAGIKLRVDRLEINNPHLPNNTNMLSITGFKYLGGSFNLRITSSFVELTCLELNKNKSIQIIMDGNSLEVIKQAKYNITSKQAILKPYNNPFGTCELPADKIGIPTSIATKLIVFQNAILFILMFLLICF